MTRVQREGEPLTKLCAGAHGCGEERWIEEFRILANGSRSAYCVDCERRYDRRRKRNPAKP